MSNHAGLATFIAELRQRLDRGELAGHPPIKLYPWLELPDPERAIRRMLARVEQYQAMDLQERRLHARERRRLAADLLALRERLGGLQAPPAPWQPG